MQDVDVSKVAAVLRMQVRQDLKAGVTVAALETGAGWLQLAVTQSPAYDKSQAVRDAFQSLAGAVAQAVLDEVGAGLKVAGMVEMARDEVSH